MCVYVYYMKGNRGEIYVPEIRMPVYIYKECVSAKSARARFCIQMKEGGKNCGADREVREKQRKKKKRVIGRERRKKDNRRHRTARDVFIEEFGRE